MIKQILIRTYYAKNGTLQGIEDEEFVRRLYAGTTPSREQILEDMGLEKDDIMTLERKFEMIVLTSREDWNGVEELLGVDSRKQAQNIQEYANWKLPKYKVKERTLSPEEEELLDAMSYMVRYGNIVKSPKEGVEFGDLFFHLVFNGEGRQLQEFLKENQKHFQKNFPVIKTNASGIEYDFICRDGIFCAKEAYTKESVERVLKELYLNSAYSNYYVGLVDYREIVKYVDKMFVDSSFFKLIPLAEMMGTTMEKAIEKLGFFVPDFINFYLAHRYLMFVDVLRPTLKIVNHNMSEPIEWPGGLASYSYLHSEKQIPGIVMQGGIPHLGGTAQELESFTAMLEGKN